MTKRWTAFLLACVMFCTSVPVAFAAEEADSTGAEQTSAETVSIPFASELPDGGVNFSQSDELDGTEDVYISRALTQEEHEEALESADFTELTYSRSYSEGTVSGSVSYAEKTANGFTDYGTQLSRYTYQFGSKTLSIGSVMKKMYNNLKTDLAKGTSSAIFRDDESGQRKLGISFTLPSRSSLGVSKSTYESLCSQFARDVGWLVYRCVDFDCPEMFYSNGSCSMGYSLSGTTFTLYLYPGSDKTMTTYSERAALKQKLDAKVNEIVTEAAEYTTAYEKLQFFNRWLCENNTYNDTAASTTAYYQSVTSGAPWSAVGALLSSSDSSVVGPVCEGYSRAMQLLCKRAGITAALIVSDEDNHMWNNVKYGTRWTGIDVTWDDSSTGEYETYFFKKVNNMSGHAMDDGDYVSWLYYPVLSEISASETLPYYISGVSGSKILPYYDVKDSFWGISQICNVYNMGYMTGTSCVYFQPDAKLTRAQFVQILYNIAGRPSVSYSARFTDVEDGKWYTNAVLWAAENGLVSGYPNGKFGVNDTIKRQDITIILYNRVGCPETEELDLASLFTDYTDITDYALEGVNWAVASGILSGNGNGKLNPQGSATRAESAVIITNITS